MNIHIVSNDGSLVHFQVAGRISQQAMACHGEPIETLAGTGAYRQRLLIGMQRTEYLDSSGVSWLLLVHKRCREAGGRLVLYGIPPIVLQVLRVLKLDKVFHLADTEQQAREILEQEGES